MRLHRIVFSGIVALTVLGGSFTIAQTAATRPAVDLGGSFIYAALQEAESNPDLRQVVLPKVAAWQARVGRHDAALQTIAQLPEPLRPAALGEVAVALYNAGHEQQADAIAGGLQGDAARSARRSLLTSRAIRLAREQNFAALDAAGKDADPGVRAWAYATAAIAISAMPQPAPAKELLRRIHADLQSGQVPPYEAMVIRNFVVIATFHTEGKDAALAFAEANGVPEQRTTLATHEASRLVARGDFQPAETLLNDLPPSHRVIVWKTAATEVERAGRADQARAFRRRAIDFARAAPSTATKLLLAELLAEATEFDEALQVASHLDSESRMRASAYATIARLDLKSRGPDAVAAWIKDLPDAQDRAQTYLALAMELASQSTRSATRPVAGRGG